MTLKKHRKKEFKRYLSLHYPRPIAQYLARHDGAGLERFGYRYAVDEGDCTTYIHLQRKELVYIDATGKWRSKELPDGYWYAFV